MAKGGHKEKCTVPGCDRDRVGWGLCGLHYQRAKTTGSINPSHRSQARAETIGEDGTRLCFKCGQRKPYTSKFFSPDPRGVDRLKGTCRACVIAATREASLRRAYGLSTKDLERMISVQDGQCAICHDPINRASKAQSPHVDHDHHTGKVRGILCHHCNVLLGHARESIHLLNAAISYLTIHSEAKEIKEAA